MQSPAAGSPGGGGSPDPLRLGRQDAQPLEVGPRVDDQHPEQQHAEQALTDRQRDLGELSSGRIAPSRCRFWRIPT